ncbi:unnamed protein product [Somion occarium]|uniref:MARVEL domain-containing protein n=1 Tax=Somion occarium TaxID=3059160 RepID=A0ABP1CY61_9APHY
MESSNTRARSSRRDKQLSRSHSTTRPSVSTSVFRFRMPTVFNIVRASLYAAVLIWTIICLAIAVHFQNILVSSDLTHFIPFAIFVCSASLLLMIALLGFGIWRDRNPISTRVELGCLGLTAVLWLALGAFLASSESEGADVECFSSSDTSEPFDMPGFNTETYHAQYRVLEAFSFFNIILIWLWLLSLLGLAIRHHRWGNRTVWLTSVTAFPWFGGPYAQTGKLNALPVPATAQRSKSGRSQRSQSRGLGAPALPEKEELRPAPRRIHTGRPEPTRNEAPTYVYWMPHSKPDPAHVRSNSSRTQTRDKYHRDASPRR